MRLRANISRYRSVLPALAALATAVAVTPVPAQSESSRLLDLIASHDPRCGSVFVVNTQNQLLGLGRMEELNGGDSLLELFTGIPHAVQIRTRRPVTGLAANESLQGIDFRPATGVLYGLGRIGVDGAGQLYT